MIPKTADGRVLFAVPWHNHALVGTTDTAVEKHAAEPKAKDEEVQFILDALKSYLIRPPEEKDVLSVFAGLRPLVAPQKGLKSTKEISRDHKLLISNSGLITITGGKWTTYRKMAEDTVAKAIEIGGLPKINCNTKELKIHGHTTTPSNDYLAGYGADREGIIKLIQENSLLGTKIINNLPHVEAQVIWAVRYEMARTVEDVLARRLRILFLNAQAAIEAAPRVAAIMKEEMQMSEEWEALQIKNFIKLAKGYLLKPESLEVSTSE